MTDFGSHNNKRFASWVKRYRLIQQQMSSHRTDVISHNDRRRLTPIKIIISKSGVIFLSLFASPTFLHGLRKTIFPTLDVYWTSRPGDKSACSYISFIRHQQSDLWLGRMGRVFHQGRIRFCALIPYFVKKKIFRIISKNIREFLPIIPFLTWISHKFYIEIYFSSKLRISAQNRIRPRFSTTSHYVSLLLLTSLWDNFWQVNLMKLTCCVVTLVRIAYCNFLTT